MRLVKILFLNICFLCLLLFAAELVWDFCHGYSLGKKVNYRGLRYNFNIDYFRKKLTDQDFRFLISAHLPEMPVYKSDKKIVDSGAKQFQQIDIEKILPHVYQHTPSSLPKNYSWRSETSVKPSNQLLYSVSQSTDAFGRRTTIQPKNMKSENIGVSFFGCSYTWGDGLRDSETLPSRFALWSDFQTQNYARNGGNPATTLETIQDNSFLDEFPGVKKNLGIFIFIPDQFYRTIPGIQYSVQFEFQSYFHLDRKGNIRRFESYKKFNPIMSAIYTGLSYSHLLADNNINFPLYVDDFAVEYNASLLREIKAEFERKNKQAVFVVVLFPGFSNLSLRYALLHEKIFTIDYSQLDFTPYCKVGCVLNPYDGHPSAEFNDIFARQILKDLMRSPEVGYFFKN